MYKSVSSLRLFIVNVAFRYFSLSDEEREDDEVSAAILKAKTTPVPEDLVPALTDKTFDIVKDKSDLLVVDFFQPCKLS